MKFIITTECFEEAFELYEHLKKTFGHPPTELLLEGEPITDIEEKDMKIIKAQSSVEQYDEIKDDGVYRQIVKVDDIVIQGGLGLSSV